MHTLLNLNHKACCINKMNLIGILIYFPVLEFFLSQYSLIYEKMKKMNPT